MVRQKGARVCWRENDKIVVPELSVHYNNTDGLLIHFYRVKLMEKLVPYDTLIYG